MLFSFFSLFSKTFHFRSQTIYAKRLWTRPKPRREGQGVDLTEDIVWSFGITVSQRLPAFLNACTCFRIRTTADAARARAKHTWQSRKNEYGTIIILFISSGWGEKSNLRHWVWMTSIRKKCHHSNGSCRHRSIPLQYFEW